MSGVHITHVSLSPRSGGDGRQLELLARGLSAQGIPQRAVVGCRRTSERLGNVPGLEVARVTSSFTALLACSGNTQIMHAHDMQAARIVMMRCRLAAVPYVLTQRSADLPLEHRARTRRILRRAGRLVGISQSVIQALLQHDASLTPVLIPSAAADTAPDPWKVDRLRRRYAGKCLVGHAGTLDDRIKGQRMLVRLARRCLVEAPSLHFLIVGSGPDIEALRDEAGTLANIEFTGWVDDVENYLHAFDIFVYPARVEAMGASLLDAMNARLPVVATRVGGVAELVSPQTGMLVPPDDENAFAAAVRELAADAPRRQAMGEAGRVQAQRFPASRMVQSYLRLYGALGYGDAPGSSAMRRPHELGR